MKQPTRGADKIISSISSQLANRTLTVGERLPSEAKLCEEYGVSRTVVREALQQLKAIGVLNTITGSGSYVSEGDLNGLKNSLEFFTVMTGDSESWIELLELRTLIESSCARKLAGEDFSAKGLGAIKAVHSELSKKMDDIKAFAKLDVKFHHTLTEVAGNSIFSAVLVSLEAMQLRFTKETYQDGAAEKLMNRNFEEHTLIIEAIEQRDPDGAEKAMKNHLAATKENLLRFIQNSNDESNYRNDS